MIYLSTGGYSNLTGYETAKHFVENDIRYIELSGGRPDDRVVDKLLTLSNCCKFQIHNYFPPAIKPFVFNLASENEVIAEQCLNHSFQSIDLAAQLGSKIYSFHAGFLFDPSVKDLGKQMNIRNLQQRAHSKKLFIDRVNQISSYAENRGVKILLENNVISEANFKAFGCNPFLMTNHSEATEIMNATDDNVALLVDVAHLKVSSDSEGFCKNRYLEITSEFTLAYHLSENDGRSDSNEAITIDSWFWPYLRKDLSYYSLEVYTQDIEVLKNQIKFAHNMLAA